MKESMTPKRWALDIFEDQKDRYGTFDYAGDEISSLLEDELSDGEKERLVGRKSRGWDDHAFQDALDERIEAVWGRLATAKGIHPDGWFEDADYPGTPGIEAMAMRWIDGPRDPAEVLGWLAGEDGAEEDIERHVRDGMGLADACTKVLAERTAGILRRMIYEKYGWR